MSWYKVCYKEEVVEDAVNIAACIRDADTSDVSTTEDSRSVENDTADTGDAPDESFTYLQGLNSDNLMQFSQQSALQELMLKERTDIKPNIDTLPSLSDHDYGGYDFQMIIMQPLLKSPWVHSDNLNKIYIRMNQTFNIDVVFTPKMPVQQLRLRAFLSFVKEVSEPVLRCQNHLSKEVDQEMKVLQSVLRCENPATIYCGTLEGKSIIDRFSVLVPLRMVASNEDTAVRQTTAFKFTCQNSCFGRKETSLVFCLENMDGEILGQRVLDVKICSCPKRDKMLDERNLPELSSSKRKLDDENGLPNNRYRKVNDLPFPIKAESNPSDLDQSECSEDEFDVERTANGRFRLVITCSDKDHLVQQLDALHDKACAGMVRDPKRARFHYSYTKKMSALKRRAKRFN